MALRTFADISSYRPAPITASPLDALIGGLQQGIQLQQLPGKIQEQQLAQQLQNAINFQKLQDLQNPQAALVRDIERQLTVKAALNPELGVVRAQPNLVGETIFSPGAITPQQQALLPTSTVAPTAPMAALPETPISAFGIQTGLNINPNIPIQAQEDDLNRKIQLANARVRSSGSGVQGQFISDGFGGMIFAQRPATPTGDVVTTRVKTPEGEAVKVVPKGSAARVPSLTPNAQTTLLGQASAAGVDVDSPKYRDEETGVYDFTKIAIDKGRAVRENKRIENASKVEGLTGKSKSEIEALNAAEKQLDFLQDEISEIAKSGKTPGFLDNLIAAETAAPPGGWLSSGWQQLLRNVQSEESKELENKKTIISSALTKAISGLAVTQQEATRLGFLPRAGESFEEVVRKASVLKSYIENQRSGLSGQPLDAPTPTAPPATGTKVGRFTIINTR